MVARAEQKLRSDVDRSLLVGTHVNRRIPVEAQFFLVVIRPRLERSNLVGIAIHASNLAALGFMLLLSSLVIVGLASALLGRDFMLRRERQ